MNPGERLGDFRIVRQLGEGGMGAVYLAQDERLDRQVALKVIAPRLAHDPEFQRRFEAEARSAAAIDDPNVVPVFSAGSEGGRLFIAMRYVDGTDLRAVLAARGALDTRQAVAIVADVAAALDAAHAAGFVHRDVKPANILLVDRAGRQTAFLSDFGLTKGLQGGGATQLTGTGQWIGTLDYVAPEQMTSGRVDARTDVYALGCVLHEMLAGSVPFPGTEMQKMWGHVNEPLPAIEGGEAGPLGEAIARATAKDPDDRFLSAGNLAHAATAAVEGTGISEVERSVATGVAASGLVEAGEVSASTRTMKGAPPARDVRAEQRTATMAAAPPRRPPGRRRGGGSSTRTVAAIGGSVILAAGLIGAALIFAGREGTTRTVVNQGAPAVPAKDGQSGAGEAESSGTDTGGDEISSSGARILYSQSLYSVEIPSGWELETGDEFQEPEDETENGYFESVWRNPDEPNTSLTVDAEAPAPSVPPIVSAESVRAQTSLSSGYRELAFEPTALAGLPAARWVFEVPGDRRVDYFVNLCNVGVAVLGSTTPSIFGSLAPTFHEAASSVSVPCE